MHQDFSPTSREETNLVVTTRSIKKLLMVLLLQKTGGVLPTKVLEVVASSEGLSCEKNKDAAKAEV